MNKENYEQRIRELESEIKIMKERYQILVETTSAILFEYKPEERLLNDRNRFKDRCFRLCEPYLYS